MKQLIMSSNIVVHLFFALTILTVTRVECNSEGDALFAWRSMLIDPNNVLQSWDPTLVNPCTWFHVTCNSDNSIIRIDLGNAGLSGSLVPQLGTLTNLQYLHVEKNMITGIIPGEFGNLTNLIYLGVSDNLLSGSIPASLANLRNLRYMNLNSNKLTGELPSTVIQLVLSGSLQNLNVSDNLLAGTRPRTRRAGYRVSSIIQDPKA